MNNLLDTRLIKAKLWVLSQGNFSFDPISEGSGNWLMWYSFDDYKRCVTCRSNTGKIYDDYPPQNEGPPYHPNCRCSIDFIKTIKAGTATVDKENGADYQLYYYNKLPDEYITKNEAKNYGWNEKKKLRTILPGRIMVGDVYSNKNGKLPDAPGRIWYEADINYVGFKRSAHRIVYSNDGLMFVTYDHYFSFYEIDDNFNIVYNFNNAEY